jgi:tetratricopeptide (TPR) repeat protein
MKKNNHFFLTTYLWLALLCLLSFSSINLSGQQLCSSEELYQAGLDEYKNTGDYPKALDYFNQSINCEASGKAYFYRGCTYKMLNDKSGAKDYLGLAIEDFKKALSLAYQPSETGIHIGHCKCMLGQKTEGLSDVIAVLDKKPELRQIRFVQNVLKECGGN